MTPEFQNPYVDGKTPSALPRRFLVIGGGLLFTLAVLCFLAWIQPSSEGERVELPPFQTAFKVERDPPPKVQPPQSERKRPPPKKRIEKPKPKKVTRTSKPRKARPTPSKRAPRNAIQGTNISLGVGGMGGGGPKIEIAETGFQETLDEAQDMLIRDELADDIRNQRYQEENDEAEERERRTPGVAKDAKRLPPPRPNYPPAAWQRQIEGSVKVRVLVEVDGSISEFEILSAKPEGYFEQAIEDEVIPNLRYEPAEDADGNPLPSWDTFTYRFSLKDY